MTLPGLFKDSEVHPHGRGDNRHRRGRRLRPERFTPTGVGTTLMWIVRKG